MSSRIDIYGEGTEVGITNKTMGPVVIYFGDDFARRMSEEEAKKLIKDLGRHLSTYKQIGDDVEGVLDIGVDVETKRVIVGTDYGQISLSRQGAMKLIEYLQGALDEGVDPTVQRQE